MAHAKAKTFSNMAHVKAKQKFRHGACQNYHFPTWHMHVKASFFLGPTWHMHVKANTFQHGTYQTYYFPTWHMSKAKKIPTVF
jgi:hypothetical protein